MSCIAYMGWKGEEYSGGLVLREDGREEGVTKTASEKRNR